MLVCALSMPFPQTNIRINVKVIFQVRLEIAATLPFYVTGYIFQEITASELNDGVVYDLFMLRIVIFEGVGV